MWAPSGRKRGGRGDLVGEVGEGSTRVLQGLQANLRNGAEGRSGGEGESRERVAAGEMLDLELMGRGRQTQKGRTRVRGDGADAQHVIYHGNTI
jgi:hypothetical protein